jgi:hypothetical protein
LYLPKHHTFLIFFIAGGFFFMLNFSIRETFVQVNSLFFDKIVLLQHRQRLSTLNRRRKLP